MRFSKIGQTILLALSLTAIIIASSCSGADATKPEKLKGNVAEISSGTTRYYATLSTNNIDLTTMSILTNYKNRTITEIVEVKDYSGNVIAVESVLRNNAGGIYQINLPAGTTGNVLYNIKYKYNHKEAYSTKKGSKSVYFSSSSEVSFEKDKGTFGYSLDSIVYGTTTYSGSVSETETNVTITSYLSSRTATVNYSCSSFGDIYVSPLTEGTDYTVTTTTNGITTNSIKLNIPTDHAGKNYIVAYTLTNNSYSTIYGTKMSIVPIDGSIDITTNAMTDTGLKSIDKIYVY